MKKVIISIFLCVIVIISIFVVKYNQNIQEIRAIKKFNSEYEEYLNREINGVDLTTVLNMALENNNSLKIDKNKDGTYKNNKENSIEIIIKPTKEREVVSNGSF